MKKYILLCVVTCLCITLISWGFKGHSATTLIVKDLDTNMKTIDAKDAANHIGAMVSITAKVYGLKDMGSMILVNLGAAYPNQLLTVVLRGEAKIKGSDIDDKTVTVKGTLIDYKGKPEIAVTDAKNLIIIPMVGKAGTRGG